MRTRRRAKTKIVYNRVGQSDDSSLTRQEFRENVFKSDEAACKNGFRLPRPPLSFILLPQLLAIDDVDAPAIAATALTTQLPLPPLPHPPLLQSPLPLILLLKPLAIDTAAAYAR